MVFCGVAPPPPPPPPLPLLFFCFGRGTDSEAFFVMDATAGEETPPATLPAAAELVVPAPVRTIFRVFAFLPGPAVEAPGEAVEEGEVVCCAGLFCDSVVAKKMIVIR